VAVFSSKIGEKPGSAKSRDRRKAGIGERLAFDRLIGWG
jgi:hypothetical protein